MDKAKRNPNALYCDDPSLTQQHFKEECDINVIVDRAQKTGMVTHLNPRVPRYEDCSISVPLHEAFAACERASALFMELPWQTRERFDNDPAKLLLFLSDPQNREEGVKLGILEPKVDVKGSTPISGVSGANGEKPKAESK